MNGRFEGKVALVTGGAGGLGLATCEALISAGAEVLLVDVDEARGRESADAIGAGFFAADVSSFERNHAMVAAAVERFGGLDLVFLNAGVATGFGVGNDFDVDAYRRVMGVNLDGVVFGTHAALPALDARGGGAIVATASLAGLTSVPMDPLYAANKHAVVGFARSLGLALVDRGIRINAICPGYSESRIIDPIRAGLAEAGIPIIPATKVAEAVLGLFAGEMTGEAWFVQPGRDAAAFEFRGIPGPRQEPASGD
ncbi:MAG: SDR family NAD(P)-dependent oxidoreductase [Actinomycetota bacterium]|nr:SDR family NAD(P)-dependent oxidoreductase [Actinomycetota bacterium]